MNARLFPAFQKEFLRYAMTVRLPNELQQAWQALVAPKLELRRGPKPQDLTGRVFSRLTVVEREGKQWRCVCECGTLVLARGTNLKTGRHKSCGCYRKERMKEQHRLKQAQRTIKDDC